MCRFLAIVASELTEFGLVLTDAPRCLATLSREHPDGWGMAIHGTTTDAAAPSSPWRLHKGTVPAELDVRFHALAASCRGDLLVAHIRQKTVGPTRLENTHPFARDGWVFAHNGTVGKQDFLRAGCSSKRLHEVTGDTDSELFFAYLLTRLDERGLLAASGVEANVRSADVNALLLDVTAELRAARIGALNFLLSDGRTTHAHRFGRSLFVLERGPDDPIRERRSVGPGAAITTRWTPRRQAVFVASERITDEPWREVPDETLLCIERLPLPRIVILTS